MEASIEVIDDFLTVGPIAPPQWVQPNNQLTHRGLLLRPIGGVFNMVMFEGRLAAFVWMHDTVRDWSDAFTNNPTSSAIFDISPGGDRDATTEAAHLLMLLSVRGEGASHGRISFRQMNATALFVTVNAPVPVPWDGMMIDATEAYWRMHLLEDFWIRIVRLELQPRMDGGDVGWRLLWSDAWDAWDQQMEELGMGGWH